MERTQKAKKSTKEQEDIRKQLAATAAWVAAEVLLSGCECCVWHKRGQIDAFSLGPPLLISNGRDGLTRWMGRE